MEDKKTKETFTLLSYDDKDIADIVCKYLLDEFRMTSDGKCEVVELAEKPKYGGKYAIIMEKYYSTFTTTIQKCRDGARDFLKGYEIGMKKAEDAAAKAWRSTLRTRGKSGIKLSSYPDPIGKAAGLKCKRVGFRDEEAYDYHSGFENGWYLFEWDECTGKGAWRHIWSEKAMVDLLTREDYLPYPPRPEA